MSSIIQNLFRTARVFRRRDLFIFPEISIPVTKIGNKGADWIIYTDELKSSSVVFSIGIGTDISFDLELIRQFNLTVFAFDPTPKSLEWLSKQELPGQLRYFPVGISDHDGFMEFFAPDNQNHTSYTVVENVYQKNINKTIKAPVKKISTILKEMGHSSIDLLKMDIEGSEYAVIDDIIKSEIPIKQLLIEFHHRFENIGLNKTKEAVKKLNLAGYKIFSISMSGEEYSFINYNY